MLNLLGLRKQNGERRERFKLGTQGIQKSDSHPIKIGKRGFINVFPFMDTCFLL